jgi:Arc/MetJ-type ribon-helix-helix transcriptional regulator
MTIQITVRLPDELVAFVDALVADGVHTSRADAVAQALTREQRRRTALRDAEILARAASVTSANAPDATDVVNEMHALADFAAAHLAALDD